MYQFFQILSGSVRISFTRCHLKWGWGVFVREIWFSGNHLKCQNRDQLGKLLASFEGRGALDAVVLQFCGQRPVPQRSRPRSRRNSSLKIETEPNPAGRSPAPICPLRRGLVPPMPRTSALISPGSSASNDNVGEPTSRGPRRQLAQAQKTLLKLPQNGNLFCLKQQYTYRLACLRAPCAFC